MISVIRPACRRFLLVGFLLGMLLLGSVAPGQEPEESPLEEPAKEADGAAESPEETSPRAAEDREPPAETDSPPVDTQDSGAEAASTEGHSGAEDEIELVEPTLREPLVVVYPQRAMRRKRRPAADVLLAVYVNERGKVMQALVRQSNDPGLGFDESAKAAVMKARFSPGSRAGEPVRAWVQVSVRFDPPMRR